MENASEPANILTDPTVTWYGPHACAECGEIIIRANFEKGGAMFDPPERLLRIYQRGSESGTPDVVYPMVWRPHVHGENRPPR